MKINCVKKSFIEYPDGSEHFTGEYEVDETETVGELIDRVWPWNHKPRAGEPAVPERINDATRASTVIEIRVCEEY